MFALVMINDGKRNETPQPAPPNKGVFGAGCFLPGTFVRTGAGANQPTENVYCGMAIKAFDLDERDWRSATIAEVQKFNEVNVGYFVVNERPGVSPYHQLFVNDGWKTAPQLEAGDMLTDEEIAVTSLRYVNEKADHYNIVLGKNPKLLYSADGLLVYNACWRAGEFLEVLVEKHPRPVLLVPVCLGDRIAEAIRVV